MSMTGPCATVSRGGLQLPWLTLSLSGLAVMWFIAAGPAPADWVFDRNAILDGEWWRLLSGHWVHSDTAHLAWNIGALIVLGWLIERTSRRLLLIALLAGMATVSLGVWLLLPGLDYYCGLSGVLNTLLLVALHRLWGETRHPIVSVTAILAVIKLIVELSSHQAVLTHTAWPSVPEAHLAGVLAGAVLVLIIAFWTRPVAK